MTAHSAAHTRHIRVRTVYTAQHTQNTQHTHTQHTKTQTQPRQEELDKQNPIIEDIDAQLHRVTTKLKSNNAKLKGLVLQVGA